MLTILDGDLISPFVLEQTAFPGVADIAAKVQDDIHRVSRNKSLSVSDALSPVFVATCGHSARLDEWEAAGVIDLSAIRGKRECYGWFQVENMLVIAGSDKRGTIYGLFHLSEIIGVTPLNHWSGLEPPQLSHIEILPTHLGCSREPSVEYRGFFINDEWPAFGNWAAKRFGGVNAKLYAEVFELLLRLKGNYLWPAMWASCFACDGPDLASAELADRWGVVMGTSHHEPCLRHGEEYSHVRGPNSEYGDAWNFRTNKEGITRFWRDGLQRNGHLENVITIGMRGERDSSILENATLQDNIDLLKDVISTQHQLIRENVNEDLTKVPRMLALYKEVEPYYYGDRDTPGLKEWSELDDVTLLLCDDNHGYVRTLPDDSMRNHPGGFGMYYHFDYHGDPISYEWINSTELNEVRYEMSLCWDHGIRKLWIVNVGDLGLQELPLNFFMDLAYDYEGTLELTARGTEIWTDIWTQNQFGHLLDAGTCRDITWLINTYTRLAHNRRPEHLNDKTYHPVYGNMAATVWDTADKIEAFTLRVDNTIRRLGEDNYGAFMELVGYNAMAIALHNRMWIATIWNHYFAERGLIVANTYAERARLAIHRDQALSKELHRVSNGRWYGFGLAKHIGFTHWNSEERQYPVLHQVFESGDTMMVTGSVHDEQWTHGGEWTGKDIYLYADDCEINASDEVVCWKFYVGATSTHDTEFCVSLETKSAKAAGILIDGQKGNLQGLLTAQNSYRVITVSAPRPSVDEKLQDNIRLSVKGPEGTAHLVLKGQRPAWLQCDAQNYSASSSEKDIQVLHGLGRDSDGLIFTRYGTDSTAPWVEYDFTLPAMCSSGTVHIFMLPANPFTSGGNIRLRYQINGGTVQDVPLLPEDYTVGHSPEWAEGVIRHVRIHEQKTDLLPGMNTVRIYGTCEELVLERVALQPE
ncbi:MAG: glycosyl hydrolase 115 family protein [Treponemataceae bacterium]|nr:glycosyl hydrolase 115 family protein [Treponemataceae bacterium]